MPMSVPKAIEILTDIIRAHASARTPDSILSIQLGIEALKRHQVRESLTYMDMVRELPGETKGD